MALQLEAELEQRRHGWVVVDNQDHAHSLIDRAGAMV